MEDSPPTIQEILLSPGRYGLTASVSNLGNAPSNPTNKSPKKSPLQTAIVGRLGRRQSYPVGYGGSATTPHVYWRVSVLYCEDQSNGNCSLATLQLRTSVGGSQAATGGTASASSELSGSYLAANAFDADANTFWIAGASVKPRPSGTRQWIKYAFASAVDIVEVAITARPTFFDETPRVFALEYSDDNSAWTTSALWSTPAWTTAATRTFAVSAGTYSGLKKFWRVAMSNGDGLLSCAELEFRATVGGATITTGGCGFLDGATTLRSSTTTAEPFFDGTTAEGYIGTTTDPRYLGYCFAAAPGTIAQVAFTARAGGFYTESPTGTDALLVQSSSDAVTWATEGTFTPAAWTSNNQVQTFNL